MHGIELRLFGANVFPLLELLSDIAAVSSTFNVFSYDEFRAEEWNYHLPNAEQMPYMLRHRRRYVQLYTELYHLEGSVDESTYQDAVYRYLPSGIRSWTIH